VSNGHPASKSPKPAGVQSPREKAAAQQPSAAATQLAKVGAGATPRRREKKDKDKEADIVKRLQAICTDADPTRLYRNLVKIGQGYV
jgi:p21-activated kinase 1